jgi:hypothetical protein
MLMKYFYMTSPDDWILAYSLNTNGIKLYSEIWKCDFYDSGYFNHSFVGYRQNDFLIVTKNDVL